MNLILYTNMKKEEFIKELLKDIKSYTKVKEEKDLYYIELCLNSAWSTGVVEVLKELRK